MLNIETLRGVLSINEAASLSLPDQPRMSARHAGTEAEVEVPNYVTLLGCSLGSISKVTGIVLVNSVTAYLLH